MTNCEEEIYLFLYSAVKENNYKICQSSKGMLGKQGKFVTSQITQHRKMIKKKVN
jgi:hypothetical protein